MHDIEPEDARGVATDELRELGLSTYAARTFVGLVSIGEGTARDVSQAVDVPRTRVYDAIEELEEAGIVDLQRTSPQRFWAVSAETASRVFEREYSHRVNRLTEALESVETSPRTTEQRGVWTVTGTNAVTERIVEFVDAATEEVIFMTVETLLDDQIVDALRRANSRGVEIRLAGMDAATGDDIRTAVPEAEPFQSLWDWSDDPAGRLLMADRQRTLVSVRVDDGPIDASQREETAIWGSGEANGLVVVLKAMFTWQLEAAEE